MAKIAVKVFRNMVRILSGHGLGKNQMVRNVKLRFIDHFKENYAEIQGHKMYLDSLFAPISVTGIWEPVQTEYIKNNVKKGDIVIDLGAHIGYFTLIFAELVGVQGRVFAFEPNPQNYSLLMKNVSVNNFTNVTTVQKAVSDETKTIQLFLSENNTGDNRIFNLNDNMKSIEIESIRLDDFFKNYDYNVGFIKMDIQGSEANALVGMKTVLEKNRHLKIISEFWPYGINGSGNSPEEFLNMLTDLGFKMNRINHIDKKIEPIEISDLDPAKFNDKSYEENLLFVRE
ncbi:MAG: FkbM family methyltransferase [Candidatus Nitrosotenuis sp.]